MVRVRATLMEELFHIRLDHQPSVLRVYADNGRSRTFNTAIEEEAYGSGAAALVPYKSLKASIQQGLFGGRLCEDVSGLTGPDLVSREGHQAVLVPNWMRLSYFSDQRAPLAFLRFCR